MLTLGNPSLPKSTHKKNCNLFFQIMKRSRGGGGGGAATGSTALSGYRDRAKERRHAEARPDQIGAGALEELALYARTGYDESKHLGGDLSQTHLVKGLDFLLLEKIRREGGGGEGASAADAEVEAALDAALDGRHAVGPRQAPSAGAGGGSGGSRSAWAAGIVVEALGAHPSRAAGAAAAVAAAASGAPGARQRAALAELLGAYFRRVKGGGGRWAKGRVTFSFPFDAALDDWEGPLMLLQGEGDAAPDREPVHMPHVLELSLHVAIVKALQPQALPGLGERRRLLGFTEDTAPALADAPPPPASAPQAPQANQPPPALAMAAAPQQPQPQQPVAPRGAAAAPHLPAPPPPLCAAAGEDEEDEDIFGGVGRYMNPLAQGLVAAATGGAGEEGRDGSSGAPAPPPALPPALPPLPHAPNGRAAGGDVEEDEWDIVERAETVKAEKVRLEQEGRVAAAAAAAAARLDPQRKAPPSKGGPSADALLKGGIRGGIQDDQRGSYEVDEDLVGAGGRGLSRVAYDTGSAAAEEDGEEAREGMRLGGQYAKPKKEQVGQQQEGQQQKQHAKASEPGAPSSEGASKRPRGDVSDWSALGGVGWAPVGGGGRVGVGGGGGRKGGSSFGGAASDMWDASAASRGGGGDSKAKKRKEDEERNKLAQLLDKRKRESGAK